MPVTATLGALSYARANLDVNREYWAVQPINDSKEFVQFKFDTSNNITYILGGDDTTATFTKLNSINGTPLDYVTGFNLTGNSNTNTKFEAFDFDSSNTNFISVGAGYANYTPASPYYTVGTGLISNVNANGTIANTRFQWPYFIPPSASFQQELRFEIIKSDNSGNYFIGITDFDGSSRRQPAIVKYDSNFTMLGRSQFGETSNATNSQTYYTSTNSIQIDSTGNVVFYYTNYVNNNRNNLFIRKLNSTPSLNAFNQLILANIWKTALQSNANSILQATDMKLDNNDNIYLTSYVNNNNTGYFTKLYANGTLEWQKALTNTKLYGTVVKSNTEIYTVGLKTDGNLWIGEFDNTGNIVWQNQLDYANNFEVPNRNNKLKIFYNSSNLYLGSTTSNNWMLIKIPDNGNIPGDGNYTFSTGQTLTYSNANVSINAGNLITANSTTFINWLTPNTFNNTNTTTSNIGTNRRICFLD